MAVTWGAEVASTQKTSIGTTEEFWGAVDMTGALLSQVSIDADPTGTTAPVDSLTVSVYLSPDGGTDWDDQAFMAFNITPASTGPAQTTFLIPSVATYRVGVVATGATNAYTADMSHRLRTA